MQEGSAMQAIDVVAGVILLQDRIILAQRKKGDHLEGLWEFPGGKIEGGETPEEALIREIEEELGIRVKPEKVLFSLTHSYPEKKVKLHFVLARTEENPKAIECQNVALVPPEEVEKYSLAPADKRAWERIRRLLKPSL